MKKCDACGKEDIIMNVVCNTFNPILRFCSKECLVEFADRGNTQLQKSEQYLRYKAIPVEEVKGCGKPSCCQNQTCVCRSFDAERLLKDALK
jgi:hypothetical protein